MSMNILIKKATLEHSADIKRISEKAWTPIRQAKSNKIGSEILNLGGCNWQERQWSTIKEHIEANRAYIALADNAVAGFITYRPSGIVDMVQIGYNAVDSDFKGLGIGTKMYDYVLNLAKAEGYKFAMVHTDLDEMHAPARRSYQKAGFNCGLPEITYYMHLDNRPKIRTNTDVTIVDYSDKYEEDINRLSVVGWENIRHEQKKLIGDEIYSVVFDGWQESKCNSVKNAMLNKKGYVALLHGKVVGFATWNTNNTLGTIGNNAVDPRYAGLGIGSTLYAHILNKMDSANLKYASVTTGLDDGHAAARRAYKKIGFDRNIAIESINYYMKLG